MSPIRCIAILIVAQAVGRCAVEGNDTTPLAQSRQSVRVVEVSEAPAMPTARGSHSGAMLGGQAVVVASGSAWSDDRTTKRWLPDTLLFDDGKWKPGPPLPHPAVEAAFASDGQRLYIVGGLTGVDMPSADSFALSLDGKQRLRIESLPQFPVRHIGGAAAILDGRLFVAGGYDDGEVTNRLRMLELNKPAGDWLDRSPIPGEARAYAALVAAGGQLYLLGGMTMDGQAMRVFKDVFEYQPMTDSWKHVGELPAAGYCWAVAAIDEDGRQLLVGGRADGAIHDDLWIVDLADLSVRGVGRTVLPTTCAPLVQIDAATFWLIGGEPDSNKTRTARVTQIRLPHAGAK
jgi:N-acetylneuraminic acid mutarotase